ncbi:MAG TPA: NAD-dependent epimerase/dehydratase family protein [Pseudonocardiaceae bacterium]|nr:NAD-dependent epimerase/dehydratase family protein [Pseudonocardiaceae bacterium]
MDVVGRGFLAQYLTEAFRDRYANVTVIAAGVTKTLAASVADFDREANLVYDVARRCRWQGRTVVFFSTSSDGMYGALDSPGHEEGPVFPTTPYGRHKLAIEAVLAQCGTRWLAVRLSHVVGSGQQPHQLVPALASQIRTGLVAVHKNVYRDLIDVRHVIAALDRILEHELTDQIVNVATGYPERVERIVTEIERRLGITARREIIEKPGAVRTMISTERLRKIMPEWDEYGFGPSYLPALLDRYVGPVRTPVVTAAEGV